MSTSTPKKPKLVRDSFTIPKAEYAAIETLKTRAIALGTSVKKSELLRAGLMLLQALNDAGFKNALAAVPALKTGRPVKEEKPVKSKATPAKAAVKAAAPAGKAAARAAAPATPAAPKAAQPVARKSPRPAPARKTAARPAVKAASN